MALDIQWEALEPVSALPGKDDAFLVRDSRTGTLYIRKALARYDKTVYEQIAKHPHPGLATVYGLHKQPDGQILALEEYVQGITLETRLKQEGGHMADIEVARIAMLLAAALRHLHSLPQPVIHRDVKLSNVIQEPNGNVRLVDYDISRVHQQNMATDTTVLGTAGYAAPEAYGFTQTDARSDIYSLGVLMHVLLCGATPQQSHYAGPLKNIVQRCLAFDPNQRYTSATELYNDLAAFTGHDGFFAPKRKNIIRYIPGFRSGKILNAILACVVYFFIFLVSLEIDLSTSVNTLVGLWVLRALTLVWLVSMLAVSTNFLGVQKHLFLTRQPALWKKIAGVILFFLFATMLYALLGSSIGMSGL